MMMINMKPIEDILRKKINQKKILRDGRAAHKKTSHLGFGFFFKIIQN